MDIPESHIQNSSEATKSRVYMIVLGTLFVGALVASSIFFLLSERELDGVEVPKEEAPLASEVDEKFVTFSEKISGENTPDSSSETTDIPPPEKNNSDVVTGNSGVSQRPLLNTEPVVHATRLSDFKKAENRWSENYSFATNDVPRNAYRALYFDSLNPKKNVRNVITDKIAVNYPWTEGESFAIDSQNFGGFWIGDIDITESAVYTIAAAVSQSEARIVINGYEVLTEGFVDIQLDPGVYRIEVEYLNNWHTTDFSATVKKKGVTYSDAQVLEKVRALGDVAVWYVGAYESANADRVIRLEVGKSSKPVVLILGAFSQVYWDIHNENDTNIAYVLYDGERLGSAVQGAVPDERVLLIDGGMSSAEYTLAANCSDLGSMFYCENIDGLAKIDTEAEMLTGKKITGFSGAYSMGDMRVPEQYIDAAMRTKILKSYEEMRNDRAEFESSQTIESLF